jgi:2-dehydropantoate 2-reductase
MHHTILGAGGIGGLIGAVLAKAGEQVTMVVRPEAVHNQPIQIWLESPLGSFVTRVKVAGEVSEPADILWIAVKATQLDSALKGIPAGAKIRYVVPLLNGIDHIKILRERFGRDRVIPATISVESERTAPGVIVHRSPFCRVNAAALGSPVLQPMMEHFRRFGFECKFIDNERTLLWGKLAFLAPLALSTTAAGAPIGSVLSDPRRRALLEGCIREACAVAVADGAEVNADALIGVATALPAPMKSSMQKDLEAGNPLELDAIAGPILRGAEKYSIAVPATRELVEAIRRKTEK